MMVNEEPVTIKLPPLADRVESRVSLAVLDSFERYAKIEAMGLKRLLEKGLFFCKERQELGVVVKIEEILFLPEKVRYVCLVDFGFGCDEIVFIDIDLEAEKREDKKQQYFIKHYERRHHADNQLLVQCPVGTNVLSVIETANGSFRVTTEVPVTKNKGHIIYMYRESVEEYIGDRE
jgi:hypothetical protein